MGSFWIFLLFAGIAAIVKRNELTTEKSAPTQDAPTDEEKEDIERRIREILGEPQQPKRAAQPAIPSEKRVAPAPSKPVRRIPKSARPNQHPGTPSAAHVQNTHSRANSGEAISLETLEHVWTDRPRTAKPVKQEPEAANSELQAIINDFTMEKAVIYAEILEPKFKEY